MTKKFVNTIWKVFPRFWSLTLDAFYDQFTESKPATTTSFILSWRVQDMKSLRLRKHTQHFYPPFLHNVRRADKSDVVHAIFSSRVHHSIIQIMITCLLFQCGYQIHALTLLSLNLPLSSSSTTSRELLPHFSSSSGWRWLDVGEKVKKIAMVNQFHGIFFLKPFIWL